MDFPRSGFWDYSIALYGRQEVAQACLGLQRRHGIDVNIVLFCLWLAASGRGAFAEGELPDALAAVQSWQKEVVRPLRKLRQRLKSPIAPAPPDLANGLRRQVAAAELDAEHIEQLILAQGPEQRLRRPGRRAPPAEQARQAALNLAAYLNASGIEPSTADKADLKVLLSAAFPTVPTEQLPLPGQQ